VATKKGWRGTSASSGPIDGLPVLFGQLVHAQDGDDVLQVLVLLQGLLDARAMLVVPLADDARVEDGRAGVERVDGGVDAQLGDLTG
jgi:hypothetical protein